MSITAAKHHYQQLIDIFNECFQQTPMITGGLMSYDAPYYLFI